MKTLLIAICFALVTPAFASTNTITKQPVEIGDNPPPKPPGDTKP